ncbi:MAG: hypothetical protein AAB571_11160 [Chloroflexota bacterium]|jgi:hypothetical protein
MATITVLLHIANEEPTMCELDQMPSLNDTIVIGKNPRKRDGKDMANILPNVTTVIWPMSRMTFIEIVPTDDDQKVISFVRE